MFSENANDSLKGRVMEFSLGDLNKEEDQAFRKIKLRVEDVKVSSDFAATAISNELCLPLGLYILHA
jgi:ribosomal protein S3AE